MPHLTEADRRLIENSCELLHRHTHYKSWRHAPDYYKHDQRTAVLALLISLGMVASDDDKPRPRHKD